MHAARSLHHLRSQIEEHLRGRVLSPFNYRDRNVFDLVSTGVPEMDARIGGLPRGALTEICGPPCSGRTSMLLSALAARTSNSEVCALVDARDSFDPATASASGVQLDRLLWVRCQNVDQSLRATDLLIQSGGFGMVAVDLSDVSARLARQVPLHVWFRFRRAVEDTSTILLLLEQETNAKTCASLVLRLQSGPTQWSETQSGASSDAAHCSHTLLLHGFDVRTEVVRSRIQTESAAEPESQSDTNSTNHSESSQKATLAVLNTNRFTRRANAKGKFG
jgi:recombination protein RecA